MSDAGNNIADYVVPQREVRTPMDMAKWTKSVAYNEYLGFVLAMNEHVKGTTLVDDCFLSDVMTALISMLNILDNWVIEIPPVDQPQRFGNSSFRTWLRRTNENAEQLLRDALPQEFHAAIAEIAPYLKDSFGNMTRIDYGTGHEMSFAMFLCCLFKIGALKEEDSAAAILKCFNSYMSLVRHLQLEYRMEPAGSHGVWSLDDYQFLPFIWGSAQLIDHPRIEPKAFTSEGFAESYAREYMFMGCIEFINKVKTGPFHEHSNQLWNISGVQSWSKVNAGLIKMYKAEVLGKFPVVQHIVFGSLLSFKEQPKETK
ncbi:serine/threonine-protein phosphatase 2A activator-like [Ornithodoros turicata]